MKKLTDIVARRADWVQRKRASFRAIAFPKFRKSVDVTDHFQMLDGESGNGDSWRSDQVLYESNKTCSMLKESVEKLRSARTVKVATCLCGAAFGSLTIDSMARKVKRRARTM